MESADPSNEARTELRAVILAGGQSRRMGRDKSFLTLGGKTLLTWIEETVSALGLPVSVLREDLEPGLGPLGGIQTAFSENCDESILFLSCDMPFLSVEVLTRLIEAAGKPYRNAHCEVSGRGGFPVLLNPYSLPILSRRLRAGYRSVNGLMRALHSVKIVIESSDEWQFLNLNTPADYTLAEGYVARMPGRDSPY